MQGLAMALSAAHGNALGCLHGAPHQPGLFSPTFPLQGLFTLMSDYQSLRAVQEDSSPLDCSLSMATTFFHQLSRLACLSSTKRLLVL